MRHDTEVNAISDLAAALRRKAKDGRKEGAEEGEIWEEMDTSLQRIYGHRLCTVLVYDRTSRLLRRIYSSKPDINAVGGAKRVTRSPWVDQVLERGDFFIGSRAEDIRSVFSDHAVLVGNGLASIFNIPVVADQAVVGSINIMNGPNAYDEPDLRWAIIVAQLIAPALIEARHRLSELDSGSEELETV